jgi:hypothetical protein
MYTRASASDYDDFKAKGWTTKELIPLMRKHETYQRASNNRDIHGFDGPIKVSFGNYTYPIAQDFLRAVESQVSHLTSIGDSMFTPSRESQLPTIFKTSSLDMEQSIVSVTYS